MNFCYYYNEPYSKCQGQSSRRTFRIAILLRSISNVPEVVTGLVTAFGSKADMPASIALTTSAAIGGEFRHRRSRLPPADGRPSGGTGGGGGLRHREPGPPGTAAGAALPLAYALRLPLSPGPTRTRKEGGVSSPEGSAPAERSCIT